MIRKPSHFFIIALFAFCFTFLGVLGSAHAQVGEALLTATPIFTPQPTHMPYSQQIFYGNQQEKLYNTLSAITSLSSPVRGIAGDWWADVVIGQPSFGQITPNQVVGNKLFNPGGIYVDRSAVPNRLYVYDAGNSRVLGFSSLGACVAGDNMGQSCTSDSDCSNSSCSVNLNKTADLILGQSSPNISSCNGDSGFQTYPNLPAPDATMLCGLRPAQVSILEGGSLATMASDGQGNFYLPDFFNNRILRYNNPFTNDSTADYVWGQPDFTHGDCNEGRSYSQPDNNSLCLTPPLGIGSLKAGVAIDSNGNLWVADTQNHRILRFPYDATLQAPAQVANLVLGQANFSTAVAGSGPNQMTNPGSVRVNANGTVYVLDGLDGWGTHGRLLVFEPPFSNGMAASQVFSGIGEPSALELTPNGELWINNGMQNAILRLTNGQLQQVLNTIVPVHGGLGIDRDMNVSLTGWNSQEVQIYTLPNYEWKYRFLQADVYGSFNQLGPRGMTDPAGLEVTDDQLIVADRSRLLFWNNLSQLTNNYPPADGVVGQPNFTTRPSWPSFTRMRADTHNRLWVLKGGGGLAQVLAYELPLVTGAQPIIQISSPIALLGGGSFSWTEGLILSGIAYQSNCDCLWLSDTYYNRVFRIRNVSSPQRVVDIVLGQKRDVNTLEIGTHCNQGRDSDNGRPTSPSQDSLCHPGGLALDQNGNLFVSDHNLEVEGNLRLLEFDANNLPASPTTAIFALPASRVYGRNGSFTEPNCLGNDPVCGPWEPAFDSNNQMIIGFNGYSGIRFPQIYQNPIVNSLPHSSLMDFYSHPYSARFDSQGRLYVLDLTRNRVLIYWSSGTPPPTFTPTPTSTPTNTPTAPPVTNTLVLQPDAAAGLDTYIYSGPKNPNYGTAVVMGVGEDNNANNLFARSLIKFDLSSIPANATINSVTLSLWTAEDLSSNPRTIRVFRLMVPFNETQATWTVSAAGVNWQTAGASGANDRESIDIGSVQILADEALNIEKQIVLTPSKIQEMVNGTFTNRGFILVADTELNDRFNYKTSDSTSASQRPKLVIQYTVGSATPTSTPTNTQTLTNTPTVTNTPTRTPTHTASPTFTFTPTNTATVGPSNTPTFTSAPPTATFTPTLTQTNTPTSTATSAAGFPSSVVLDNFNRANGVPGITWGGATSGYSIVSNRLDVGTGDALFWNAASFGTSQEVFYMFTAVDLAGVNQALLLKSQSSKAWSNGAIKVSYDAVGQRVQVWTYSSAQGWVQRGADIPVTFVNGDQFGARAKADGTVEVYRNGVLIGSCSVSAWTYAANGGYIGVWFQNASNAVVDDFGGGTVAP